MKINENFKNEFREPLHKLEPRDVIRHALNSWEH